MKKLFTSESVTEGHPDKICDQISDAILDYIIEQDPMARVACETTCCTGLVNIMGEISTTAFADIRDIARKTILEIGYNKAEYGFEGNSCGIISSIIEQSSDIAMGVNASLEQKEGQNDKNYSIGAGDQGLMFGYACDETPELMPLSVSLAHKLAKKLAEVRKDGTLDFLRPDGKSQVTVEYGDNGRPKRLEAVVVSAQHDEVDIKKVREGILREVIYKTVPASLMDDKTKIYINPTGRFVTGGPAGDSGLTGRKIIVDTYGGYARHGGGCFSGKDPTKVDRSASYMARYIAKNVVAAGLALKCEVQLAYVIGVASPVSVSVESFGTGKVPDGKIADAIVKTFDMRPAAIIDKLDLRKPIYKKLAAYGHMGREDLGVLWEKIDAVPMLLSNI